jgi:hypothetical protein
MIYQCVPCGFSSNLKANYNQHVATKKHCKNCPETIEAVVEPIIIEKIVNEEIASLQSEIVELKAARVQDAAEYKINLLQIELKYCHQIIELQKGLVHTPSKHQAAAPQALKLEKEQAKEEKLAKRKAADEADRIEKEIKMNEKKEKTKLRNEQDALEKQNAQKIIHDLKVASTAERNQKIKSDQKKESTASSTAEKIQRAEANIQAYVSDVVKKQEKVLTQELDQYPIQALGYMSADNFIRNNRDYRKWIPDEHFEFIKSFREKAMWLTANTDCKSKDKMPAPHIIRKISTFYAECSTVQPK